MCRWFAILLPLLAAVAVLVGGCGEECLPCTETSPCPLDGLSFELEATASFESCGDRSLKTGHATLLFGTLVGNEVVITLYDPDGIPGVYQGGVCNSDPGKEIPEYGFSGTMFVGDPSADPQVFYSVAGIVIGSDPPEASGSISLSVIYANEPDNSCFLQGTLTPYTGL